MGGGKCVLDNSREMRNLFELALSNQANRLANISDISDKELNEITKEEHPEWHSMRGVDYSTLVLIYKIKETGV